jgi:hypothetical protein
MCRKPFKSTVGLFPMKQRMQRLPRPGVGVVFCSEACSKRFAIEIGGNPLLYDFGVVSERKCTGCRAALLPEYLFARCLVCRVTIYMSNAIRKEAAKNERFRKTLDAERAFKSRRPPRSLDLKTWD